MWKIAVGFVIFAAVAVWMLSKGGDIDIGGEKQGDEAMKPPAATAPAETAASAPAAVTAKPASAP